MPKAVRTSAIWIAMLCLMVFLAACGGSGSGAESAKSGEVVDPSSAYSGVQTKAVPTEGNAMALAIGGFGGSRIANSIQSVAKTSGDSPAKTWTDRPAFQLAQMLKQSIRRMDLPSKAAQLRAPAQFATPAKGVARTSNFQLQGEGGGTASYSIDVNDATGNLFGTVVYQGFTSNGMVVDGTTEVFGTVEANGQQFSHLTLSFRSLAIHSEDYSFSLTGSLSWGLNLDSSTEALSMDTVLLDKDSTKTYWFNNYQFTTVYSGDSLSQTISGRYYDHDNGYVELTTQTPLVYTYNDRLPFKGSLVFTGNLDRWVRLNFLKSTLIVEADTVGSGAADWQTELSTNASSPVNSPPSADAGPDQSVAQWATVQLDGSASSDHDGDLLSYSWSIITSPDYTALTGANTATPSFSAHVPGTYVLSLSVYDGNSTSPPDTVTVQVAPLAQEDPTFVAQKWQYGIYGSSIGRAGLFSTDLDGDGVQEILASAAAGGFGDNVLWYVIRQNANGGYEQVWRSPIYGVSIVRLLLADLTGDGKDEVVVALADGTIRIYDGPTLAELPSLELPAVPRDVAVADLDGDGKKEIVSSDGIGVSVHDAQTGALKWNAAAGGGNSIAVGNVDSDTALEIVTTTYGAKGCVLNGITGAVKWEYLNSFGAKVRLADLDGDGLQEIIGASSWYKITVFDADLKSPAWEVATEQDIGTLAVTDTDGDGVPEIIYGDGQWGTVHAIDVRSRTERWSVKNPQHGVSGIAIGDVDKDGQKELLWGAGGSSTGADFLFIADPLTGAIKWQNLDFSGLSSVDVGDVDDDGEADIVMASSYSNSGYDGGVISIFDAKTHTLKYQANLGNRDLMGSNRALRIGDLDGDGRAEFVVSTANLYAGLIQVYDGATRTLKRQSAGYDGNFFSAIAIGDVDSDNKIEIVAGTGREHTGAKGVYLIVFDGATMQEKWRSVDLGVYWGSVYDIKLADLDQDGHNDIVATMTDNRLIIFDGVTHTLKLMIDSPARAVELADVDGDGFLEILVGRNDGKIDVHDGVTFAIRKTVSAFGTTPIDALRVADLDGNGSKEWLTSSNGVLSIIDGQLLKWRSSYLGTSLGKNNNLAVKDVDGNGRQDIFIGTDPVLYQFE